MFYLPRICEHCLNPSCMASCPSGAIYKRAEDGIVLVDQDRCRGWRQCVTGCPYKKIYFNHKSGKAEKCTFCYPRIEVGLPTVCSETCVGRLRYLGLFLYDADRGHRGCRDPGPTSRPVRSPARPDARPERPEVVAAAARDRASPRTGWTRRDAPRCTPWPRRTGWRCRCTRSTARCRWSGTCRRSLRSSTCSREQGHDAEDHEQPVRRHRCAADPGRVPRRAVHGRSTPTSSPTSAQARRHALYMRGITLGREPDEPSLPRSACPRSRCTRCTG